MRFGLVEAAGPCLKYKPEAQASESQECLIDGRSKYDRAVSEEFC